MRDRAKQTTIPIGSLQVGNFQMSDGSYRMSQASAAEAVNLAHRNVSDFIRSKTIKAFLGEGYTGSASQVDVESRDQSRGQTCINVIPLELVAVYWQWQSHRGNKQALSLCIAEGMTEPDALREENERLRQPIRDMDGEPWQYPLPESGEKNS